MAGRKKCSQVSRSEYDDDILRNNVRADNRLNRELRDVERAQKVMFQDISFEVHRIRSKMPSSNRELPHRSASYPKCLSQLSGGGRGEEPEGGSVTIGEKSENAVYSDEDSSESLMRRNRRKIWEALSTPKHPNTTRAVRDRLQTEFSNARDSPSGSLTYLPVIHGMTIRGDTPASSTQTGRPAPRTPVRDAGSAPFKSTPKLL